MEKITRIESPYRRELRKKRIMILSMIGVLLAVLLILIYGLGMTLKRDYDQKKAVAEATYPPIPTTLPTKQ